jgi:hypothetical protein
MALSARFPLAPPPVQQGDAGQPHDNRERSEPSYKMPQLICDHIGQRRKKAPPERGKARLVDCATRGCTILRLIQSISHGQSILRAARDRPRHLYGAQRKNWIANANCRDRSPRAGPTRHRAAGPTSLPRTPAAPGRLQLHPFVEKPPPPPLAPVRAAGTCGDRDGRWQDKAGTVTRRSSWLTASSRVQLANLKPTTQAEKPQRRVGA